jgi:hypothetical protein
VVGSPAIAALIAHVSFWILIAWGWYAHELGLRGVLAFLALWAVGLYGLPYAPYGSALFPSYVAFLDVALVLVIFKGDVPVS